MSAAYGAGRPRKKMKAMDEILSVKFDSFHFEGRAIEEIIEPNDNDGVLVVILKDGRLF